jgi:DNA-binding LytR/AlgR family response regulator
MKKPTAVIAEDEPLLRAELRETLALLWPELHVVAEAEDGVQALRALHEHAPQMLFLDIEMPGLTGLEVAAQ